jgi:hypothetical protein
MAATAASRMPSFPAATMLSSEIAAGYLGLLGLLGLQGFLDLM